MPHPGLWKTSFVNISSANSVCLADSLYWYCWTSLCSATRFSLYLTLYNEGPGERAKQSAIDDGNHTKVEFQDVKHKMLDSRTVTERKSTKKRTRDGEMVEINDATENTKSYQDMEKTRGTNKWNSRWQDHWDAKESMLCVCCVCCVLPTAVSGLLPKNVQSVKQRRYLSHRVLCSNIFPFLKYYNEAKRPAKFPEAWQLKLLFCNFCPTTAFSMQRLWFFFLFLIHF